mmetsp:Transcript_71947/g.224343  ORF Transcript_71947/g.224343 Transcript_71947/m.224343 type:complete len:200 (+) Transcript_71947:1132-1731(+)
MGLLQATGLLPLATRQAPLRRAPQDRLMHRGQRALQHRPRPCVQRMLRLHRVLREQRTLRLCLRWRRPRQLLLLRPRLREPRAPQQQRRTLGEQRRPVPQRRPRLCEQLRPRWPRPRPRERRHAPRLHLTRREQRRRRRPGLRGRRAPLLRLTRPGHWELLLCPRLRERRAPRKLWTPPRRQRRLRGCRRRILEQPRRL